MRHAKQCMCLLLSLAATLILGASTASVALAMVEAPYWKVGGSRLNPGETESTVVRNVPKTSVTISGELKPARGEKTTPVEVRCGQLKSRENTQTKSENTEIVGSRPESDSLAGLAITLEGCVLWLKAGEKSVEEKLCTVMPIEVEKALAGKLWYEGTKTLGGREIAALFEKSGAANSIGNVTLKGASCPWAGNHPIEGSFAGRLSPVDGESVVNKLVLSSIAELWQPQASGLEVSPKLTVDGLAATLNAELEIELVKKAKFGAFNV